MIDNLLTPNIIKRSVFERDHDFLDSLETVRDLWPDHDLRHRRLWNHAALVVRPDAIAGGQVRAIFPLLREHGLMPTVVRPVQFTIAQTEAIWRYQSNVATPERRDLLKRLMATGPSIYMILLDQTLRTTAPATVHVTYLKGTAIIRKRKRWHLRTVAGPAVANLFSYIHVSDDPADLLREMAVLFAEPARADMLAQLNAGIDRTCEALSLIRLLESAVRKDALFPCPARSHDAARDGVSGPADEWTDIVRLAKTCRNFVDGESYAGRQATIPDDRELSLPLDADLIFTELGPRF